MAVSLLTNYNKTYSIHGESDVIERKGLYGRVSREERERINVVLTLNPKDKNFKNGLASCVT